jgi:hypothetical protein
MLLVRWGNFIDGTGATHSSKSSGSPSLSYRRASWVEVIDMWAWPPLTVNRALHGSDGEEVKAPSTLRTIPNDRFDFFSMV